MTAFIPATEEQVKETIAMMFQRFTVTQLLTVSSVITAGIVEDLQKTKKQLENEQELIQLDSSN